MQELWDNGAHLAPRAFVFDPVFTPPCLDTPVSSLSLQRAPETSPGWEMSGLGEVQAGQEMQSTYGEERWGSWEGLLAPPGGLMQRWGSSEVWGAHLSWGLPLP